MPRAKPPTPEDDDDLPTPRGKITVPAKKVAAKKSKRKRATPARPGDMDEIPASNPTRHRAARSVADAIDDAEDEPDLPMPTPEMDGFRQDNQRSREFAAQMRARLSNEPVFPFPPELHDELKPYWVELVNSFPKTHFQVSDVTMMKMYCQCAYDIERQNELIREEGEVVMGARAPITNPRCKVRESNRATLLALATKFRNQPASRQNSVNGKRGMQRAQQAAQGADAVMEDGDGLLAGGDDGVYEDDDIPQTRH